MTAREESQLEKLDEVAEAYDEVSQFVDWLFESGITLAAPLRPGSEQLIPVACSRTDIVHQYFDIDSRWLEKERRELLASLR